VKIGILAHDFVTWGGGVDFLRTVIDSLLATPRAEYAEFHLLIPDSGPRLTWRRIRRGVKQAAKSLVSGRPPPLEHTPSSTFVFESFAEFRDRLAIQHIDIGRRALIRAAERLDLNVVIPAVHSLKRDFPRPWVAYAYDFQHKYFPQNFPPDDCRSRDEHFAELLTQSRAVIVNSRMAAADIAKFVPQATAHIFALPFAPAPSRDWLENRPDILPRYDIAPPFFIISNQFWLHKDHATAFEAFRIVAARNPSVALVCTGSTAGSRNPDYFAGLMNKLKSWKLDQRVRVLGLIPKRDQIELMKNACALVQPTLFEGGPGGGAVYDAVSLGVPAIVSDIPVNRELDGDAIEFFPASDATALAGKMKSRLAAPHVCASGGELVLVGRRRRAACGEVLWSAIDFVT
jgi:glycosyltransferase involved in cell wall biosynthesis